MRPTYPTNRLHNQHPPPPASESREQPNRAAIGRTILDADSPVQGVKIARRNTLKASACSALILLELPPISKLVRPSRPLRSNSSYQPRIVSSSKNRTSATS